MSDIVDKMIAREALIKDLRLLLTSCGSRELGDVVEKGLNAVRDVALERLKKESPKDYTMFETLRGLNDSKSSR